MTFQKITQQMLEKNPELGQYLKGADLKTGKRGGTFVGTYDVAPASFRKYGIVLPKGGMIVPDMSPAELRELLMADYNAAQKKDEEERKKNRAELVRVVTDYLQGSELKGVTVVEKTSRESHTFGSTAVAEVILQRGDDELLTIRSEREAYKCLSDREDVYEDWGVWQIDNDVLTTFFLEETEILFARKIFADRINRLVEMSHAVCQQEVGEDGWDRPRVELFLWDDYEKVNDWGFFGRRCQSVFSAHRIMYRKKLYQLTEQDVAELEKEVGRRAEKAEARQKMLTELFFKYLGVFSYESRSYEPAEVRHSFVDGKVKNDSWTERHYFLGKEEVTHEEYEWLNSFLSEIEVPEGYVRVKNDTNNLLLVPEIQGKNDVLVVIGKTGSYRGNKIYGEVFRGHPSECTLPLYRYQRENIQLNGKSPTEYFNLDKWKKPREIAMWALRETGVNKEDDSSFMNEEYYKVVDAVVRYYVDHGLINLSSSEL